MSMQPLRLRLKSLELSKEIVYNLRPYDTGRRLRKATRGRHDSAGPAIHWTLSEMFSAELDESPTI